MRTTFLRCSAVAAAVLMLVACADRTAQDESSEPVERTGVSFFWMEREVSVLTLERMFAETGSEEVLGNTDERSLETLTTAQVVRPIEGGEGHEVVLDQGRWDAGAIDALNAYGHLDGALNGVMWANEVTWCEGAPDGETFVNAYTEEFTEAFDTREEYTASAADYVDCGDGRP